MDGVAQVSNGNNAVAAVTSDGALYVWGANDTGALGFSPSFTDRAIYPIRLMDEIVSVAVGHGHTLVIKTDGSLWGWGNYSALGIGVTHPEARNFRRNEIGRLVNQDFTPIPDPVVHRIMDDVTAVAVGSGHSLALTSSGVLYAWGRNYEGQIGSGTVDGTPHPARGPYPIKIKEGVAAIVSGSVNSAAITYDGGLYVWGLNSSGQIGNGSYEKQPSPIRVMDNVTHMAISGGVDNVHMLAITSDGSLWGWGCNMFGQLGMSPGEVERSSLPLLIREGV